MSEHIIGFGPTHIPASTVVTITASPQCVFKGLRLCNTGDVEDLFISAFFVGNRKQFEMSDPIALSTFKDNEVRLDTCQPGLNLTIQIQNHGKMPRIFSMSLIGVELAPDTELVLLKNRAAFLEEKLETALQLLHSTHGHEWCERRAALRLSVEEKRHM